MSIEFGNVISWYVLFDSVVLAQLFLLVVIFKVSMNLPSYLIIQRPFHKQNPFWYKHIVFPPLHVYIDIVLLHL